MAQFSRKQILQNCLNKLAKEFNVPAPMLTIPDKWQRENCGGLFIELPPTIMINPRYYFNDLAFAIKILRHEFAHYLIVRLELRIKKQEMTCVAFERKITALGILPHSQKTLQFATNEKEGKK
jgi:predicted SprT family Zn-dependent metalloprotease